MKKYIWIILLLFFIVFMRPMGTTLYPNSLPSIRIVFDTTIFNAQLTVTVFCFLVGITQLVYGALVDYYSRKKIVITSLLIFTVGCYLSIFSGNIYIFFVSIILQGIGMGSNVAVTARILNDIISEKRLLAKIFSMVGFIFGLSVMIWPILGGFIQEYLGWQWNFLFMGNYAIIIMLLLWTFFQDKSTTIPLKKEAFKKVGNSLKLLFSQKTFLLPIFILSLFNAFIFYLKAIYPFLVEELLNLKIINYSVFMFLVGAIYMVGIIINIFIVNRLRFYTIGLIGLSLAFCGSILFLLFLVFNVMNIYLLFLPLFFTSFGSSFVFPNTMALLTSKYKNIAGLCGACIGFSLYTIPSLITLLLEGFKIVTPLEIAFTGIMFWVISTIIFIVSKELYANN